MDERAFKALRELAEEVAQATDPADLRELVLRLYKLLDVIEVQVARLEGRKPPLRH